MPVTPALLKDCKRGNSQAQFELYREYYSYIRSVCARYNHQSQDLNGLVNQAFFKILTRLDLYKPEIPFELWAKKVAIHVVIDDHRKNKKYRQLTVVKEVAEIEDESTLVDWNLAEKELDRQTLEKLLGELPELYGKIFCLNAIDGFSHKEIATLLNIKEGTSKWYLSEARKMLKQQIAARLKKNEYLWNQIK
jgi:RNA polymerase sigma factor (sigma-70 family)